jgi:hypothetical protein
LLPNPHTAVQEGPERRTAEDIQRFRELAPDALSRLVGVLNDYELAFANALRGLDAAERQCALRIARALLDEVGDQLPLLTV